MGRISHILWKKKCSKPPTSKHVFSLDCGFCLMQKNIHQQKCQKVSKKEPECSKPPVIIIVYDSSSSSVLTKPLQQWFSDVNLWNMVTYALIRVGCFKGTYMGNHALCHGIFGGHSIPNPPVGVFSSKHFGSSVELQRVVASGRPRSQKSRTSWCSALKSSKEFSWMGGFSDITLRWVYVNMICCSNLKTIDQSCWSCQQCGFPPFGHSLLVHFRPGPHQKTNQSNNTLSSKHCKTVCWTWVVWCYLYNVILWQLMSFDVILCRLMTFNVIWCPLMLFNVIWCQLLSFDVISCHLMSFDDI